MNKMVEAIREYEPSQEFGFYSFWAAYPRRKGANPRAVAEKKYLLAIKNGATPEHLLSSVLKYTDELKEQNLIGTPYVCMASTWLNQKRWLDYAPDPAGEARINKADTFMKSKGWGWNGQRWVKERPDAEDLL